MEQGNQVVKSPWSSWQFGVNYMYDKGKGAYKGAGDKAEKYPYEGIFTRSTNAFVRSTNIQNTKKLELYNEFLKDLEKTKSNSPLSINREIPNKGKLWTIRKKISGRRALCYENWSGNLSKNYNSKRCKNKYSL